MKATTFALLVVGAASLIHSPRADAAYVGLSLEYSNALFNHPNWPPQQPPPHISIYRLYANFNSNTAADRVNAVAGTPESPFAVNVTLGVFHNYTEDVHGETFHFHTPSLNPIERAWDTWVTIGQATNGGTTGLTPGFAEQTSNLGYQTTSIFATNVAWFITPADAQGQAVASAPGQLPAPPGTFRVLLAQFSVSSVVSPIIQGSLLLNVNGVDLPNQTFYIPAPSALLVLGFLACRNRRRRQ